MLNNSMKDTILQLIQNKPKQYVKLIKKNPELLTWVNTNSLIKTGKLSEKIYSALYQVDNVCPYNNLKKFDRISTGFVGCGHANKCLCVKEKISFNVAKTKKLYTPAQNKTINEKRKNTKISK